MATTLQRTPFVFYRSPQGREPVREWLHGLPVGDRHVIGQDLMRTQFRWPVGMPLVRAMGEGLFEVRSTLPSQRISRVLLCHFDGVLVGLHGFIKKTQSTPKSDIYLARQRMKEVTR